MPLEEQWKLEDPDTTEMRKNYGETYSDAIYKKWIHDEWYAHYDPASEEEQAYSKVIKNSAMSEDGLKQLRAILGLEGDYEYKPEELVQKQKERYATVNQAAWA